MGGILDFSDYRGIFLLHPARAGRKIKITKENGKR